MSRVIINTRYGSILETGLSKLIGTASVNSDNLNLTEIIEKLIINTYVNTVYFYRL